MLSIFNLRPSTEEFIDPRLLDPAVWVTMVGSGSSLNPGLHT